MNAYDAMISGAEYSINDPQLVEIRYQTRDKVDIFNQLGARQVVEKRALLTQIFAQVGDNVHVEKPLRVDYGCNTRFGSNVFINFNLTVLDTAAITVGDNVFIGPNVALYAALHPLDALERARHVGTALPINIGNHVWIAGNVTILPGVTLGEGCVIGAGSVVTKSIPAGMLAAGNPCRVIRPVSSDDRS